MTKWKDYPPTDDTRSGCKVGWRYYQTRAEAEACSKAARWNGRVKEEMGYDFGYCAPGHITELPDGRFEVCIP
jgi:hypothetical protein